MSTLKSRSLVVLLVLCFAAVLLLPACSVEEERPWNVLLVTFDTTRADRIESYGNDRVKTPTLSRLASEGYQFDNAFSAVPITTPSHSTIMTGLYPMAHGVRDNGLFTLGKSQVTLAEMLKEKGYATAAAVGAYPVTSRFGLNQGFDFFDDHLTGFVEDYLGQRATPKTRLFFDERRAAQVNEAVLPWLSEHAENPFFLWVHYFDPHQPFEPPPPYDQLYADDLYNGEIAYSDESLGSLISHLEKLGQLDRTLIVMVSDHGEGLGEHNEVTHAVLAYNSTLHVPLIIRPPSGEPVGTVIKQHVGTVDILPTILDLLGMGIPDTLQGRSLVGLMKGWEDEAPRYYAENLSPYLMHSWAKLRVLFEGPYKYVHGTYPELYDLEADPGELHNLAKKHPDEIDRMRSTLAAFIADHTVGTSTTQEMDAEVIHRLQSLGYLSGNSDGGTSISEELQDGGISPAERVGDLNDMSAAKQLLFKGQYSVALPFTRKLVASSPDSPTYKELHATALAYTGHLAEAWRVLEELLATGSPTESLVLSLAAKRFESGEHEQVVRFLERYSETVSSKQVYWLLAAFYGRMQQPDEKVAALERALAADSTFVQARVDLAVYHAEQGEYDAAEREFLRALEDNPYYPKSAFNYAAFLMNEGRTREAVGHFRRAIDISPTYVKAYNGLIVALIALDQREEARQAVEKLRHVAANNVDLSRAEALLDMRAK
jgi:arylsulfatase A-like enzyme/tetratricopeptide (TPR) repeat protein